MDRIDLAFMLLQLLLTHTKKVAFIARRLNKLMQNIYVLCHASLAKICKLWLVSLNPRKKKNFRKKIGADGGRVYLTQNCYIKKAISKIPITITNFYFIALQKSLIRFQILGIFEVAFSHQMNSTTVWASNLWKRRLK